MKIIDERDTNEPSLCEACKDEYNGSIEVLLVLTKDFQVNLSLCRKCRDKLNKILKVQNVWKKGN